MCFVFSAHFTTIYFHDEPDSFRYQLLTGISFVASPAFILISGMMVAFLRELRPERFGAFRRTLVDKGLFLLTLGHVAIALSHIPGYGLRSSFVCLFITDVIAICILVGPAIVAHVRAPARLAIGAALIATSWAFVVGREAGVVPAIFLVELLFGPPIAQGGLVTGWPPVPWLGLYLVATYFGERLGRLEAAGEDARVKRLLAYSGAGFVLAGATLKLAARAKGLDLDVPVESALFAMTSPIRKFPPSIAYFLFYGGCAFFILWTMASLDGTRLFARTRATLETVGQTSLFAFVAQFFVYYTALYLLDLPVGPLWPVIFAGTVALLIGATLLWHRSGWNRFLTVGWVGFADRRDARIAAEASPVPAD